jgi:hypothetical protein
MASALSKGSCGGTVSGCNFVFSTYATNLWEVCLVCIRSFPFVVCGTGGVVSRGFWPLVEGGSVSTAMGWSSVCCI